MRFLTPAVMPESLRFWPATTLRDEVSGPRRQWRYERRLSAIYRRHGVIGLYAVTGVVMMPATVLYAAATAAIGTGLYLNASPGECLKLAAIAAGLALVGAIAGVATLHKIVDSDVEWSRSPSAEDALLNWRNLKLGTVVYSVRAVTGVIIAELPWAGFAAHDMHRGAWVGVLLAAIVLVCAAAFAPVAVLIADVIFRPRTQDVASYLPDDVSPSMHGLSSRAKTLMPVPGTIVYTAVLAGALTPDLSGPGRAIVGMAVGIVLGALVISLLGISSGAALDPISYLVQATQQIKDGHLPADVPVLNNDELGMLSRSFNSMLVGLREREALRDRNAELVDELRASCERIVSAADAARRQVERDLHDGAQQRLVLLGLKLGVLERTAAAQAAAVAGTDAILHNPLGISFEDLHSEVRAALDELRRLAHGIYPQSLRSEGLPGALTEAADHAAIPVEITARGMTRHAEEFEAAVYFCCLEALQNAAKHGGQGVSARVELSQDRDRLSFVVRDDGDGFEVRHGVRSVGLQNMRDRLGAVGGTVEIHSAPGRGTAVVGSIPLVGDVCTPRETALLDAALGVTLRA